MRGPQSRVRRASGSRVRGGCRSRGTRNTVRPIWKASSRSSGPGSTGNKGHSGGIFDVFALPLSVNPLVRRRAEVSLPSYNCGYAPKLSVEGAFGLKNSGIRRISVMHQPILMCCMDKMKGIASCGRDPRRRSAITVADRGREKRLQDPSAVKLPPAVLRCGGSAPGININLH